MSEEHEGLPASKYILQNGVWNISVNIKEKVSIKEIEDLVNSLSSMEFMHITFIKREKTT
jgi:hypothetical protein